MNKDEKVARSEFSLTIRNVPVLLVATAVVAWLVRALGSIGKIIGVVHVLLLGVFGWQALISTSLFVAALLKYPFHPPEIRKTFQPGWIILAIIISVFEATVYGICIYLVGKIARWWN